jgi:tetratricopeptide (TPR) repeat protein
MTDGLKKENITNNDIQFTTMKLKATLLFVFLLSITFGSAQNEECMTKLSLMNEAAKAKSYDTAYPYLMELRKNCPKYNLAIYTKGEIILKSKIGRAAAGEKKAFVEDLIKLYDERMTFFASKTPKGKYQAKGVQLMYDNNNLFNLSDEKLYNDFDAIYKTDTKNFSNAKSLYVYFKLMVVLYDAGKKPAADLFNKYDDVVERINSETESYEGKLNKLVAKEASSALTTKDKKYKKNYEQNIVAFEKVSGSVDKELGDRANCTTLVPLYSKDFEENKTNALWLKRAVSKMFYKECTDDPLYEKLVKAYDSAESSAETKYFVATILLKNKKETEAMSYFKQSFDLQDDKLKKAKLANKIGAILKKRGRKSEARNYFQDALRLNPSNKNPHLLIASMYASSANGCGTTNFNKRAVFWLAAKEAAKAGARGSKYVKSYKAKAPTKSEIFQEGNAGTSIKIGCWINRSVTVPSL